MDFWAFKALFCCLLSATIFSLPTNLHVFLVDIVRRKKMFINLNCLHFRPYEFKMRDQHVLETVEFLSIMETTFSATSPLANNLK